MSLAAVATTVLTQRANALGLSSEAAAALLGLVLPPAIIALYLIKSALGINLLPGPSPLHELFYHLVR